VAQSGLGNGIIINGYKIFFFGAFGAAASSSHFLPKILLMAQLNSFKAASSLVQSNHY